MDSCFLLGGEGRQDAQVLVLLHRMFYPQALYWYIATQMIFPSLSEFNLVGWWPCSLCKMNFWVSVKKSSWSQLFHKG